MNRSTLNSAVIAFSVLLATQACVMAQGIYWTETDSARVMVANLDGSNPRELVKNHQPRQMAVDSAGGHLYWFDYHTIVRSSLNGTAIVELVTVPAEKWSNIWGYQIDVPGQKMYWLINDGFCQGCAGLYRANLDGSAVDFLLPMNSDSRALVADFARGKLYWAETYVEEDSRIQRANLDGSNIETFQAPCVNCGLYDLAVDASDGSVYWTEAANGLIRRADVDGSNVETVQTGLYWPHSLMIDSAGAKLYWSESTGAPFYRDAVIRRSNLDGSNVETVRNISFANVAALEIDPVGGHLLAITDYQSVRDMVIERSALNGTGVAALIEPKFTAPKALAVDQGSSRLLFLTQESTSRLFEMNVYDPANQTHSWFYNSTSELALSEATGAVFGSSMAGCDSGGQSKIVRRGAAAGSPWQSVIASNIECPAGLAIDDPTSKLYWIESIAGNIMTSNLDGSGMQAIASSGWWLLDVAVNSAMGTLYWMGTDSAVGPSYITRAKFDGTFQQVVVSEPGIIERLAVDEKNGRLYWTTPESIMISNLDGSDKQTIVTGLAGAYGIAVVTCAPSECGGLKNRFLSYDAGTDNAAAGEPVAIRVKLLDSPLFPAMNGQVYWAGGHTTSIDGFANETLNVARLQCTPALQDWPGIVHFYGAEIVPESAYEIRHATASCVALGEESCLSEAKVLRTGRWGDIIQPFYSLENPIQQPDFADISAAVDKFAERAGSLSRTRAKLYGDVPDPASQVNFSDISAVVDAFRGAAYPYSGPQACP